MDGLEFNISFVSLMKKQWILKERYPEDIAHSLERFTDLSRQLLWNRGIRNNEDAERFLNPDYIRDTHDPFRMKNMERAVERILRAIEKKEKIMGFGHRIYKNGDPRAKVLRELSKEVCGKVGKSHLFEMSVHLHEVMEGQKGLHPNVDFYSASLYHCLGIPTDLFTPVFAVSRISGWLAHVMEQKTANKLIRPESMYVGKNDRKWTPIMQR